MRYPLAASGMSFLHDHGARRSQESNAPDFRSASPPGTADVADEPGDGEYNAIGCDYEIPLSRWRAINASPEKSVVARQIAWLPSRFVDGKDVGSAVAYLIAPGGFAVPLRLAQVGAVAMHAARSSGENAEFLCAESRSVEVVVSLMADLFAWDEIERFATALSAQNIRLLVSRPLREGEDPFNIGWMRENARSRTREEMFRHERDMVSSVGISTPTLVDGPLEQKTTPEHATAPLFGIIKTHANTGLLNRDGWRLVYDLKPGQRTPLITYRSNKHAMNITTWYLRLKEGSGDPLGGVVRVGMMRSFFEDTTHCDLDFVNRLSGWLCRRVTCDPYYGRAAVTLEPIRRAEEVLGARFQSIERLTRGFYRVASL